MPLDTSRQSAYLMSLYQAGFLPNISPELRSELESGIMLQKERDPLRLNFPVESPERRELVKTYIDAIRQGAPVVFNGPDDENNDGNDQGGDLITETDGFTNVFTGPAGTVFTVPATDLESPTTNTPPVLTTGVQPGTGSGTAYATDTDNTLPLTDSNSVPSAGSNLCSEPDETLCERGLDAIPGITPDYVFGLPDANCSGDYRCPPTTTDGSPLCGCFVDDSICLNCVDNPANTCEDCLGLVVVGCCYDNGTLDVFPADCCAEA